MICLLLTTVHSVVQNLAQVVYGKYGKHPREALFYTHALPLPGFLLLAPDIAHHLSLLLASPPLVLPGTAIQLPSAALYLLGNVITQYIW